MTRHGAPSAGGAPVRCLVIGEYTMGHVPYIDNLDRTASSRDDIDLDVVRLPFPVDGALGKLPGYSTNWSVRASVLARCVPARRWRDAEVVLVHTQTSTLLLPGRMRAVPTWVSTDATPQNLDQLATAYAHRVWPAAVEGAKKALLRRPLAAADGFVVWSSWAGRSLVDDYGVPPGRVHVVRAGTQLPTAARRPVDRPTGGPVRLLFVGGDFPRKGGPHLLTAFRGLTGDVTLDLVTHADVPAEPGVRVHRSLTPGSPGLLALMEQADVAVLPTLGDASPYAVVEAMAYGLPVVTTDIGAVGEAVQHGRTGLLVPPADPVALRHALQALVDQPEQRRRLGVAGRARAEELFDGDRNAGRVLDLLRDAAISRRAG